MKIFCIVCLSVVLGLPQVALAADPNSTQVIAQIESSLNFCGQLNPSEAAQHQLNSQLLVATFHKSAQQLANLRKTNEYKHAYNAMSAQLAQIPTSQAAATCSSFVQGQ